MLLDGPARADERLLGCPARNRHLPTEIVKAAATSKYRHGSYLSVQVLLPSGMGAVRPCSVTPNTQHAASERSKESQPHTLGAIHHAPAGAIMHSEPAPDRAALAGA